MQTLHGTSRHPGTAMAMAVVVDVEGGLSGVPEQVMKEGLKALRMQLPKAEWPEVIIACDLLGIGSAILLPGVRVIGIAAEAEDEPAFPLSVPCVAGVCDLTQKIASEDIVIVDADEGMVHIDPDVETVIRYQNATKEEPPPRVFLESADIPARTQDGRTVLVAGVVSSTAEAETAISQGADALVVRFAELAASELHSARPHYRDPRIELLQMLAALAAGKLLTIYLPEEDDVLIEQARRFTGSETTFVGPGDEPPAAMSDAEVKSAICAGAELVYVSPCAVSAMKDLIRILPEEEMEGANCSTKRRI